MMKETTVTKPTVNNLRSGQIVRAGYKRGDRDFTDDNRFVGFIVGDARFFTLAEVKKTFNVSNLRDLEFETERLKLGTVTAEWFNCDENYSWGAYLWNGAFRVGTSADRLQLATA
jgi:hypothetical protein